MKKHLTKNQRLYLEFDYFHCGYESHMWEKLGIETISTESFETVHYNKKTKEYISSIEIIKRLNNFSYDQALLFACNAVGIDISKDTLNHLEIQFSNKWLKYSQIFVSNFRIKTARFSQPLITIYDILKLIHTYLDLNNFGNKTENGFEWNETDRLDFAAEYMYYLYKVGIIKSKSRPIEESFSFYYFKMCRTFFSWGVYADV